MIFCDFYKNLVESLVKSLFPTFLGILIHYHKSLFVDVFSGYDFLFVFLNGICYGMFSSKALNFSLVFIHLQWSCLQSSFTAVSFRYHWFFYRQSFMVVSLKQLLWTGTPVLPLLLWLNLICCKLASPQDSVFALLLLFYISYFNRY